MYSVCCHHLLNNFAWYSYIANAGMWTRVLFFILQQTLKIWTRLVNGNKYIFFFSVI